MVDVALLVVWLLFMAVLIAMPFTPDERYATWPFWLLAFQYWTFGIPFFTGFLFILTDVRVLRRAAPRLRLLQGARLRILGIALVVVGVIAVGVTMAIANAHGTSDRLVGGRASAPSVGGYLSRPSQEG